MIHFCFIIFQYNFIALNRFTLGWHFCCFVFIKHFIFSLNLSLLVHTRVFLYFISFVFRFIQIPTLLTYYLNNNKRPIKITFCLADDRLAISQYRPLSWYYTQHLQNIKGISYIFPWEKSPNTIRHATDNSAIIASG